MRMAFLALQPLAFLLLGLASGAVRGSFTLLLVVLPRAVGRGHLKGRSQCARQCGGRSVALTQIREPPDRQTLRRAEGVDEVAEVAHGRAGRT